jgi:hypothetical protein
MSVVMPVKRRIFFIIGFSFERTLRDVRLMLPWGITLRPVFGSIAEAVAQTPPMNGHGKS